MIKGYKQFYIEFEVSIDPFKYDRRKVLGCFAAIAANSLSRLVYIELRSKTGAYEYRFVDESDVEVSIPVEVGKDPRSIADEILTEIACHPELGKFIKEEKEKKAEG